MKLEIGQRWRYKDSGHDFILEITSLPNKSIIVHTYYGDHMPGQHYTAYSIEKSNDGETFSYEYLVGQDKPQ